jgi:hypothetical protein
VQLAEINRNTIAAPRHRCTVLISEVVALDDHIAQIDADA